MKKKKIMISLLALCCFTSCEPTNTTVEWTRTIQKNEVLTIATSNDCSTYNEGAVFTAYKNKEYDVVITKSYSNGYTNVTRHYVNITYWSIHKEVTYTKE